VNTTITPNAVWYSLLTAVLQQNPLRGEAQREILGMKAGVLSAQSE
jgi:hypothetical protein